MPYTAEHKSRTRARIVAAARELFNRRGFIDVSIDDVMAEAGLTRGGFYNHFANKEELLLAAVDTYRQCNPTDRWEDVDLDFDAPPPDLLDQMISAYLSEAHLDDVAGHCPLVALPADVAHAGPMVRRAYRLLLDRMVGIFAAGIGDEYRARAIAAQCVGAMLIGRTIGDREEARRWLAASRRAARELASVPQRSARHPGAERAGAAGARSR